MVWIWIGLGIIIVLAIIVVYYINRIIVLSNRIDNAWSQIDVQLKKRADLVPNLVETVKAYVKHERKIFLQVARARTEMLKARGPQKRLRAGAKLGEVLKTLFAIAENYPKLRASENFKLLQEQLEGIENKIAYSRQFYNDSTLIYNNMISTIPGRWFASLMGRIKQKPYLAISEAERKPVKVRF
ncbi:MAG: LemA family protein [Candidatus Aenigmatarchaeota archaeon]